QTSLKGYFQHVLFRPADGTLTNLSTCATGITADTSRLSGVHSSLLGSDFLCMNETTTTETSPEAVTLDILDARDGSRVGTYTTSSIAPNGQAVISMSTIEAAAHVSPS